MPKRKHECNEAPGWLTTMGDMSLLLMVFFVLLVSFMTLDRTKYLRLEEALEALSMVGQVEGERSANLSGTTAAQEFKAFNNQPAAETKRKRIDGSYSKTQKIRDGTVYTVAGETSSFAQGQWTLTQDQKEALVTIKRWMWGRRNIIEIRGHVSANIEDSVVVENGTYRPFDKTRDMNRPDKWEGVDHSLLSYLRASEVKKFFLKASQLELEDGFVDDMAFKETQLRIRADSFTRNLADPLVEVDRVVNRRIEVVATQEMLED